MSKSPSPLKQDMRRTTEVLELAAHDIGDQFLQYLYGMAALHLDEKSGKRQRSEAPALNDPQVAKAARIIANGR